MNIYDTANQLAQEIQQSEEYMTYKTAKEAINLKIKEVVKRKPKVKIKEENSL